jgi:hypothetical protein
MIAAAVILSMTCWLGDVGLACSLWSLATILVFAGVLWKRSGLVTFGCLLVCVLGGVSPWLFASQQWVGHRKVSVTVRVQDQGGAAIPNATVVLTSTAGNSAGLCDPSGDASVVGEFQTCGRDSALSHTGYIEVLGEQLGVTAKGYKPVQRDLGELTRGWDLYAAAPQVVVRLESDKETPAR